MSAHHLRPGVPDRHAVLWVTGVLALSLLLIVLDQLTGPYVRVSIGFVVPVTLVAYRWGWAAAAAVGLVLGSSRVWLVAGSRTPWLVLPEMANFGLSLTVFLLVAGAVSRLGRAGRSPDEEHSMLPVCGGCGRVRTATGRWIRFERLVSTLASVDFRHTVCPECEQRLTGDLPGGRR